MARYTHEIMNREVLTFLADAPAAEALREIRHHHVSCAPVVGETRVPLGMLSLRDLTGVLVGERAADRMSSPPIPIGAKTTIRDAAARMEEHGIHHLPVVDEGGRLIGIISTIDVIRGLLGRPARHPQRFPNLDPETEVSWSDLAPLHEPAIRRGAWRGPGVLVVFHGDADVPERLILAEAADDIQARLLELLSPDDPSLNTWWADGRLRFQFASIQDADEQSDVLMALRPRLTVGSHRG